MPRYKWNINDILFEEDVEKLFVRANYYEKIAIALLWLTGARTGELVELRRKDFRICDEQVEITIKTFKLRKTEKFQIAERTLVFKLENNKWLNFICAAVLRLKNPEDRILPRSPRWVQQRLNKLGRECLGKEITAYHFRHSVLTWLAKNGATVDQLMHWKGARSLGSVEPYLHAVPQVIKLSNLRRSKD